MKAHSEWAVNKKHTEISRIFPFPSFIAALAFAAKITVYAEIMQHHPIIEISYGKLKVKITTDEAKGLTNKDFQLAKEIDALDTH